MKSVLFSIFFFVFSYTLFGQNLGLSDMMGLINKPGWEEANTTLLNKKWEYYDSQQGNSEHYSTITWSFNKESFNDQAEAWIYLYCYEDIPGKVRFFVFNREAFNRINNSLNTFGFKRIKSDILDNSVISVYSNNKYILRLETSKQKDSDNYGSSMTSYDVALTKKSSVYDPNNGQKKTYFSNGNIREDYFLLNGELHGKYKSYHENGKLAISGEYVNGKKNGHFMEFDILGYKTIDYKVRNNLLSGSAYFYQKGLLHEKRNYWNDEMHGTCYEYGYDDNDSLSFKVVSQYDNGLLDGKVTAYLIDNGEETEYAFENYKNGLKHGRSKKYFGSDSLIIANYKNGELDGQYLLKMNLNSFLEDGTMFSLWFEKESGTYRNGLKDGVWKEYSMGNISAEGSYLNDLKEGVWKEYVTWGNYIGEILSETPYEKGNRSGLSKTFYIQTYEEDTLSEALKFISYPIAITEIYENDKLNGKVICKDSIGNLQWEGTYVEGKKEGLWIERQGNWGENSALFSRGNYENGFKRGEFIWYEEAGHIIANNHYYQDDKHGVETIYTISGKAEEIRRYDFGDISSIEILDTISTKALRKYEFYDDNTNSYRCRYTEYFSKGYKIEEYFIAEEEIDVNNFDFMFFLKTKYSSNTKAYIDGLVITYNLRDQVISEGEMYKDEYRGTWSFFFYDENVKLQKEYKDNMVSSERYYLIGGGVYSGKLKIEGEDSVEIRTIKKSYRHGKTFLYDKNDNLIRKEVYKWGEKKV